MPFVSNIHPDIPIINDRNVHIFAPGPGKAVVNGQPMSHGLTPRDRTKHPRIYGAEPFGLDLIPESEWDDRMEQEEKDESSLEHLILEAKLPPLNQQQTLFCWADSSTMASQILRMREGEPLVPLSPASVACPINGFVNQGGWCGQSIRQIAEHGIAPASMWPPNAIDRRYYTDEERAEAKKYRVQKWFELEGRNREQLATCLLNGFPVPSDYNFWSHSVCSIRLVRTKGGNLGTLIFNSWGPSYGRGGMAVLEWPRGVPDDAVCPQVIRARKAA